MKKKVWVTAAAFVLCTAIIFQTLRVQAITSDRDNGVQSVHVSDSDIENSTLAIGSYLIHINGLTDEIYSLAQESANTFNQNNMYYKSELADGRWYEITDATSIADITSEGTPVDTSVIESLEFTHKVAADGTITDLRTGETVGSYDINDPYDLEGMEELEPIKLRYQFLTAKESKSDSDDKNIEIIGIFYGLSIKNSTTDSCDTKLSALETYKNGLSDRGKPSSWVSAVDTVATAVDAERRVESLTILTNYLDALMKKVTGQEAETMTRAEYEERLAAAETESQKQLVTEEYQLRLNTGGTFSSVGLNSDYQEDSELIDAISQARSNVESSITTYTAKLLTEGSTATTKAVYQYSNDLIDCANNGDESGADTATEKLVNLQNILKSVIADASGELDTLTNGLIEEAFQAWKDKLSAGVSAEYQQAVAAGASDSTRSSYLTQQKSETNAARTEYQTMLDEAWKRMANDKAQEDVLTRIDGIGDLEALVPADDAETYQLETVSEHLTWLRGELSDLVAESGDSSELDKLKREKDDLELQRQEALDKNDLSTAKRLAAEIEAKQTDMDNLTKELTDVLNSDTASESDKAKALAGLSDGSAAKMLNTLASSITSGIRDGSDTNATQNQLAAFSALSSYDTSAASAALAEIQDALDGSTALDSDLKDELENTVSSISESIETASTAGQNLSTSELKSLLSSYFADLLGTGSSTASEAQKSAALIALSMYAEDTDNSDARALAASLAGMMAQAGNSYIYEKYDKETTEYLSLKAVSRVYSYRYIYDNAHYTVTLSQSQKYYLFTSGKETYMSTGKVPGTMTKAAGLMGTLYISSEDGSNIFNCTGYYIPKSNYASVRTQAMESEIQTVYQMLMEGGA